MANKSLIPIRIEFTRGVVNGQVQNVYPNFNRLPPNLREGMDWSQFFDAHGIGMHYDQVSQLGQSDTYNPNPDSQFAFTCVPEDFAQEASKLFPTQVRILTEEEFEHAYDNRCHQADPEHHVDVNALQAIVLKKQLEDLGYLEKPDEAEIQRRKNALNPDHPSTGIRKNHAKRWAQFRENRKLTISYSLRKKPQ